MITPPLLVDVTPGDPITSEAWNNVLAAIGLIVDDVNHQNGTFTAKVRSQGDGNPLRTATVTVVATGAPARPTRGGIFVGGDVGGHQIERLLPGTYSLTVDADDYASQTQAVTMPADGAGLSVTIDLVASPARFAVPSLLGVALSQALATLGTAGFTVARVIDSHGVDVPPGAVPADVQPLPVLAQFPEPSTLAPKSVGMFIHVAARAEVLKKVGVPDIRGMSVAQAKAALEDAGLLLGTTKTVTT